MEMCATTTVTMKHLERCHEQIHAAVFEEYQARKNLPHISFAGRTLQNLQDTYIEYLEMWILTSPTISMSIVENPWFTKIQKRLLHSLSQVPCRRTLDNRMTEIHERLKKLMKKVLNNSDKICISLGIWTKRNFLSSFLGVLASFYSTQKQEKMVLLLNVKKISTITHTHQDVLRELESVLQETKSTGRKYCSPSQTLGAIW